MYGGRQGQGEHWAFRLITAMLRNRNTNMCCFNILLMCWLVILNVLLNLAVVPTVWISDKFCGTVPQRSYVDQIEHKQCVMNRCTCHPSGEKSWLKKTWSLQIKLPVTKRLEGEREGKKERHTKYRTSNRRLWLSKQQSQSRMTPPAPPPLPSIRSRRYIHCTRRN